MSCYWQVSSWLVKNLNKPVHISDCRTPGIKLGRATILGKDAHLLTKYMHDADNKYGLRVTNLRGDKWIVYGDGMRQCGMLLKEESRDNLKIVVEAMQTPGPGCSKLV